MPTIWYVGDREQDTWPVGNYPSRQAAADANNIRVWRLAEGTSQEQVWAEQGYVVHRAAMAVADDRRAMAQKGGRVKGPQKARTKKQARFAALVGWAKRKGTTPPSREEV
jgi:hypothetical protein